MTELYIEGVAAVLPENMNLSVKRENPFFTKNGEYTYELTLSLNNAINAALYKHLNRLNSISEVKTKRKVILIADNREYCNGTEIITGWTENTVSIQIASGNSEMNYLIGGNLLLSMLNLGTADLSNPKQYIEKKYPEVEFCLSPVVMSNGEAVNDWRISIFATMQRPTQWRGEHSGEKKYPTVSDITGGSATFYAQPYLCAYIKKIMQALGYTLTFNELSTSEWNTLFLLQNAHPTDYALMFPGWTVAEFIAEIEKMFNVLFLTNNKGKEVGIVFRNSFYTSRKRVSVRQTIDMYQCEVTEIQQSVSESNVKINAPDTPYYKMQHFSQALIASAAKVNVQSEADVYANTEDAPYEDVKGALFFTEDKKRYYIAVPSEGIASAKYTEVNQFGDLIRENTDVEIEMNITPAPYCEYSPKERIDNIDNDPLLGSYSRLGSYTVDEELTKLDLPLLQGELVSETTEKGLYEQITEEVEATSAGTSALMMTFYQGMKDLAVFPKVRRDELNELEHGPFDVQFIKYPFPFNDYDSSTFQGNIRTTYLNKQLYEGEYGVETGKAFKVKSFDPNIFDPRDIFEIRNKLYVCKDIEYILTKEGRKKAWTGTFYALADKEKDMNINTSQWILADGNWRDNNVWLDNGRWLDE